MTAIAYQNALDNFNPKVRGGVEYDASLARYTWFRTGGCADILFIPADERDLCDFLSQLPIDVPILPLGVGSNMLIRDGGVDGVVIRMGKKFSKITVQENTITVGAGAPDISVARAALDAGITGFEFLRGVPGTIGGALKMNAGAYGSEIKDIFQSATVVDRHGKIREITSEEMGFSYRHTDVLDDFIFMKAIFNGTSGDVNQIKARMDEIGDAREESQPLRTRTGGSTFKNPDGLSAWKLVDGAGCRGLKIGGARVSEKHCNFLINEGDATASDIEELGEEVRRRVMNNSGVKLTWEIKRVGRRI